MMRWLILATLLCCPGFCLQLSAQYRTYLGINVSPLILNTLEVRADMQLTPGFAVQSSLGMRLQRNLDGRPPSLGALSNFVGRQNYAGFLSLGARFINPADNRYDYPFLAIDFTGLYLDEEYLLTDQSGGGLPTPVAFRGFTFGVSATMGFVVYVSDRWRADLGLQIGYAPPRDDLVAYFYPGLGYSTFGRGIIGIRGGHIQPLIAFKYNILQDRRQRIRSME